MIKVSIFLFSAILMQSTTVDMIKELYLNEFKFGDTKENFLFYAGTADREELSFHEIERQDITTLTYGKSEFIFMNDKLEDIHFLDSTFILMPYNIKVGTHTELLKKTFPISYAHREGNETNYRLWIALYDTSILFEVKDSCVVEISSNSST